MAFSRLSKTVATVVLAIFGVAYPSVVYAVMGGLPMSVFVIVALVLILVRLSLIRKSGEGWLLAGPLIAAAVITGLLGVLDAAIAVKGYPVLMSLGFAAAFGLSLWKPPCLVEVFARRSTRNPSPEALLHMRRVTQVWCVFLVVNAMISTITAWRSEWELWALYNGLIVYLLMGLLFAGEWLVRRRLPAQDGDGT